MCLDIDLIISLDANIPENILYFDSSRPMDLDSYNRNMSIAKDKVDSLYKQCKALLIKKLLKR